MPNLAQFFSATALAFMSLAAPVFAQGGVPLPGQSGGDVSAPLPGNGSFTGTMPAAGAIRKPGAGKGGGFSYGDLPLSPDDAKGRIVEMTNMMAVGRPQDMESKINQLSDWLADMVDAHNKMANAFGRQPVTKNQATAERQMAQRFVGLRNQAQLMKADLLINMRRYPEAIGPLVDIVIAEPTSATGQGAYKRLKNLGFSPDGSPAGSAPAPVSAAPNAVAAPVAAVAPATPANKRAANVTYAKK
jgi:hypothetical protein